MNNEQMNLNELVRIAEKCSFDLEIDNDSYLITVKSKDFGSTIVWVDGHIFYEEAGDIRVVFRKIPYEKKLPFSDDISDKISAKINAGLSTGRCNFRSGFGCVVDYALYIDKVENISVEMFKRTIKYLHDSNSSAESRIERELRDLDQS